MNENALFERVVKHIGDYLELDVSHLEMDSRLATAVPGLDSLKQFEMLFYLEDCFKIQFDATIMESIETMRHLVVYINTQLSATATSRP